MIWRKEIHHLIAETEDFEELDKSYYSDGYWTNHIIRLEKVEESLDQVY